MPTLQAVLPRPSADVWTLFTTEAVGDWLLPELMARKFTIEPYDGGEWVYGDPADAVHVRGVYIHYREGERLHFRWRLSGAFIDDEMDIRFQDIPEGCLLTLSYPPSKADPEEDDSRARLMLTSLRAALDARAESH